MDITCDALLIDSDGTLVDSEASIRRAWAVWCAEHGLDAVAVHHAAQGRRSADTIADVLPPERFAAGLDRLNELELGDLADVVAVAGAAKLVAGLTPDVWAVVTSGHLPLVSARLNAARLPAPKVLVTADDVRLGKPHPEGYQLAASSLGVDPARCVVFEDSAAGVAAGKAAGAFVVALTTTHPAAELTQADVVVPDLRSVRVLPKPTDPRGLAASAAWLSLRIG